MSKPRTLQELATKAHDMKVFIANRCSSSFSVAKLRKDKADSKTNVKFSKNSTKEVMSISKAKPVRITGRPNLVEKRSVPFKDTTRIRPTVKEL